MDISNIDDMLMGGKAPSEIPPQDAPEPIEEMETDLPDYGNDEEPDVPDEPDADDSSHDEEPEEKGARDAQEDEYGNKTDDLSEKMQDRLKRQAESMRRKHEAEMAELRAQLANANINPQIKQAASQFEFDPESKVSPADQLQAFIEQTVSNMTNKEQERQRQAEENRAQKEFEDRFHNGMSRFSDFVETIDALPCQISNPMTLATRAMKDPAAFLYAAAKRAPQELERISKIRDPYAQMTEMGKLEERMRKNKPATQAPRPLGRPKDDGVVPQPKKKREETIEDMIAKAEAKKLAQLRQRRGK